MNARQSATTTTPPPLPDDLSRGYQWKALFLPSGTLLRMTRSSDTFYARVEGDRIVYQGRSVSPRGFTQAIAGEGRNAWRDLWIRFPGEHLWINANRCRIQAQQSATPPALTPAQSMQLAAAAMAQALDAALKLVEHSCAQALDHPERRVARHRRQVDLLGDDCAFD